MKRKIICDKDTDLNLCTERIAVVLLLITSTYNLSGFELDYQVDFYFDLDIQFEVDTH